MRTILALMAAVVLLSACNKTKKTEDGLVEYKIFKTIDTARAVVKGDMLLLNMKGIAKTKDTVLFNSYESGKPFYIPAEEPTLKGLFSLLKKGDSLEFFVNADSLYLKSFGSPAPESLGSGEIIHFTASLVDVYSQEEMQKKMEEQNAEVIARDSATVAAYVATLSGVQTTATGLMYTVTKKGSGKKAKKGDNISVQYVGSLLDGTVFDQTKAGSPDFNFSVGMGQVIPGWDEAFQMMSEGDEYKLVIPWSLAYGPRGNGPIPPYSSLVFEVKLVKIN